MKRRATCLGGLGILAVSCAGLAGCGWPPGYLLHVIPGELEFLSMSQSIDSALDDPDLTDEQKEKLAFVVRARTYAEDVIGLKVDDNYREFVNLRGEVLAWNVSASRRDKFEAYVWTFPFVGSIPYLGYFDQGLAESLRDSLVQQGYDTMIYEVDAFALPGLPDPITSAILERDHITLADTIMHESLHNTIFRFGDTTFDESLATWVGRTAGVEFLRSEFGQDDPILEEARQHYEDEDRFTAFLHGLVDELNTIYESDLSYDEKLEARAPVFESARRRFADEIQPRMNNPDHYEPYTELIVNNAFLLADVRYNSNLVVFQRIFDMTGGDWPRTLDLFAQAAASDDPISFLNGQTATGE